ncbi:MAG: response regulator transcription factor [Flavobacteriales bacterium]
MSIVPPYQTTLKMIEVLLCDDHKIFRDGIRATLAGVDDVCIIAEAETGIECLERMKEVLPDVVLLDISMPEMDGIECLQQIKLLYPFVKVIALTQFDEKRFIKQMMKFGADGYILKSTSKRELLLALNQVMKNRTYLAEAADNALQEIVSEDPVSQLFPNLSTRERQIIKMLCHEHNTKQIAQQLEISFHTVESHRSNIFKKVGVSNLAGLVRWAVNNDLD